MKRIVFLLTICSPLLINAQGFQVSLQGQKQQAMAGAGSAYMQDGSALFFNPGGVSFLKGNSVSMGVTPAISHVTFVEASSHSVSETTSPVSYPFTGYLVLGKKESKLKYGFAAYTPFGSTIEWQKGWTGRFITTRIQLASVFLQPTMSYKISDKVGIGAGFVFGTGKINIQRDLPVADDKDNYGNATVAGNAHGYGFNAGIYYMPVDKLSLGLNYRSQVNMNLRNGKATFNTPASLSSQFPSGGITTSLPLPQIITFGAAYHASKKMTLVFDASFAGWKSFDTLSFDFEKNTSYVADIHSARNYKNAYSLRLGGEYAINSKFDGRAGIKYLSSPVTEGYLSPELPDAANLNYSVGIGYKFSPAFTADLSFTFQKMKRKDSNVEYNFSGEYNTNIYMPGISLSYNF